MDKKVKKYFRGRFILYRGDSMFMEILFGIIFFVLPIVGMFITVLTSKLRQVNHLSNKRTQQQNVLWDMPKLMPKIGKRVPKHFFNHKVYGGRPDVWRLDTS